MSQADIMLENRQNVICQSMTLFKKKGVENTTVYDLAHACHLTPRSIFRYFGSKDKLMAEVAIGFWQEIYSEIDKIYRQIASPKEVSGYTQLEEMLGGLPKAYKKLKSSLMLLAEIEIYLYKHKVLSSEFKPFENNIATLSSPIHNALDKGKNDGSIRNDLDIFRTHNLIINIIAGVTEKQAYADLDEQLRLKLQPENQIKDCCEMILKYIKA